jgi:hypothetical protein
MTSRPTKRRNRTIFLIAIASLAAAAAVAYLADYLSLRLGIPSRAQFDSVEVRRFYAVKLKNRQTSYMFDDPKPTDCVNALFPHYGDNPCWYTRRHTTVRINIDSGPFGAWIDTP